MEVDKTTRVIRNRFYWRRMDNDIDQFCRDCLICHRNKPKHKPNERLVPLEIAYKPREVVANDVATLPWSTTNHRYFLLLIDVFSKFVELYPMPDQESRTIIDAIQDVWIHRHGPPTTMLSDQGPNLDGLEIRKFLAKLGIHKREVRSGRQGDGQSERGIQSVKQIMRCMLEEKEIAKDSWPSILPQVSYI